MHLVQTNLLPTWQVDLSDNDLGPEGAKAIAPAIRYSRSLSQVLALSPALTHCSFLNLAAFHHFADQPEFKQVVRRRARI